MTSSNSAANGGSFEYSKEVKAWAKKRLREDREYIQHRAQFAPEPIKSIAKLILKIGDENETM